MDYLTRDMMAFNAVFFLFYDQQSNVAMSRSISAEAYNIFKNSVYQHIIKVKTHFSSYN